MSFYYGNTQFRLISQFHIQASQHQKTKYFLHLAHVNNHIDNVGFCYTCQLPKQDGSWVSYEGRIGKRSRHELICSNNDSDSTSKGIKVVLLLHLDESDEGSEMENDELEE